MKQRVWELDAFRGICILGMVIVHFVYDLVDLYGIIDWQYPAWFTLIKDCGFLFIVLSGICATLGSRSMRRGAIVLCCGLVISAVTYGMYALDYVSKGVIIYFGVLHCLGACMLLWPVFKKLPWQALLAIGILFVALGFVVNPIRSDLKLLMPLGIRWSDFQSSDYFPLLPNLGYFLIGAALGRTVYREKRSLFPNVQGNSGFFGFLSACGRQSLWIYMLHQPILSGICWLIMTIK